jgi:hypothetical protein
VNPVPYNINYMRAITAHAALAAERAIPSKNMACKKVPAAAADGIGKGKTRVCRLMSSFFAAAGSD